MVQLTAPTGIALVCFGALLHRFATTLLAFGVTQHTQVGHHEHLIVAGHHVDPHQVDFVERGAVPGSVVAFAGGGIDETPVFQHFEPNPLDNEAHFPAGELGMLGAPLTVASARLCDPAKQALLEPKWFWCPEDPTCQKCSRNWDRNTQVTNAFKEPAHLQTRTNFYKKTFKTVPYNTVTVQAVNHGQVHLWLNWVCSCEAHGFNVRESTLMVPADAEAEKVILAAGFHSVGLDWQEALGDNKIQGEYNGKAGSSQQHSDINNILMMATAELLAAGHHVLMVDVDIAWIRDPRLWLANDALSADVLAMVAARWDAQGTANTGMVFMRSNRRTRLLMESIVNLFPIKGWSDQVLFNQVLRHFQMRQVSFHNLPTRLFPVLPGAAKDIAKAAWHAEAYTVHAVGGHKEQRLHEAGLMFYNATCSIFHKNLKPWVTIAPDGRKGYVKGKSTRPDPLPSARVPGGVRIEKKRDG